MAAPRPILSLYRNYREFGPVRFAIFAIMILAWVAAGVYLYRTANYPARCPGLNFVDAYGCSFELPTTRGWRESGLFVWLWSTPILIILEMMRRSSKKEEQIRERRRRGR